MSEGSLANRYRQYKVGTAKVVTWLAQTARKSQDVTNILPTLKAANNAAKQTKHNKKPPAEDTTVTITTNQLLRLAQVIVDAGLRAPQEILRTIRMVIQGREHCAEWYKFMHTDPEQHLGHQHFIKIMKDILRMFDTAKEPSANTSASSPSSKSTAESTYGLSYSLSNMFELLQIDEPSPNALGSAPTQATKAVTFELEVTHHEKSFAIWCLLQDLRELRHELISLWLDYKNGKVSFDNVSMLTSHGIGFIFYAQREFENQYPDLNSYPSIIEHVGLHVAQMFDEVYICPQDSKTSPAISKGRVAADDIAQLFCPRASLILKGFIDVLSRKIGKTSMFPKFQEPMQIAEGFLRVHPLGELLLSLMPQLAAISRKGAGSRATEDPFLNVLHLLADHPHTRPPIWVLQAIQIHMDIYDIVGSSVEREMLQFQRSLASNSERMEAIHDYLENRSSGSIRDTLLKDCVEFEESCTQLAKDPYYRTDLKGTTSKSLAKKAYPMYEAFPAIPGQIIKVVAVGVHYRGTTCCDVGRVVLSAAYLYRAAIKIGAITKPWADMEFVIETQSKSRPYVLETESGDGLAFMARAFGIALGVKASAYRRGQRPKLPTHAAIEREARRMVADYPLEAEYKDRDNVSIPGSKTSLVQLGMECLERLQQSGRGSARLVEVYQQYKKTGRLTPTHLLLSMKEQFMVDEMDMNFDYFGFFNTCLTMIGEVLTEFESHMPARIVSIRGITTEYVPAYVTVHTILWDAADRATSNTSSKQSLLFRAKAIIEDVIEQMGDECVKLAKKKMENLRRPLVAQSDKADESEQMKEPDDEDFLTNLFGTSTKETRGPGMFCRSTAEVEARINVRRAQEIAKCCPGESSSSQLVNAVFKVLAIPLAGLSDDEHTGSLSRLDKALRTSMGEAYDRTELKDLLTMYVRRRLQQAVPGGDAPSKDGTDGKENAKP